jgi:hypothetical protein
MDMSSQKQPSWVEADVNTYPSVLNSIIRYAQQLASKNNNAASTSTGFIPINMSLTMTGLSGMKIYQEFTINTSYLPTNYSREMTFIIKGINHTIQNNIWSTTIETLSLPKITTKPDVVQTTVKQVLKAGTSNTLVLGDAADYWALIAVIAAENYVNNVQGMADVAQSIYNRFNVLGQGYGKTIKGIIVRSGQYEPTFKNRADWLAINSKETAIIAYQNSKNVSRQQAEQAINNAVIAQKAPNLREEAKRFVGSRTEFLAAQPNSSEATGMVERSPAGINNVFYWRYEGKTYYYDTRTKQFKPATDIPKKLINPNFV